MAISSPRRLLSHHRDHHHTLGSDSEGDSSFARQISLNKQVSAMSESSFQGNSHINLKRKSPKKQQEEWDKEIPEVC